MGPTFHIEVPVLETKLLGEIPTRCKRCGLGVKAGDRTCMHCGVDAPGLGLGRRGHLLTWIFITLVVGLVVYTALRGQL